MSTRKMPDASSSLASGILAGICLLLMLLPVAGIPAQTLPSTDLPDAPDDSSSSAGNWTKKAPATSPTARSRHFMVYDAPTKKIVLFGGTTGGGETWVYDTASDTWTEKTPATSPSSRNAHAMAYDTKRNLVLLYGGTNGGGETWTYDASADTWTDKSPSGSPAARTDTKIVYEPTTDRFILFGGRIASGRTDDMYAYDPQNNSWMSLPLPTKPSARHRHSMAADPVARKIVLQGGCIEDNCASAFSDETWHLDAAAGGWTKVNPSSNPGQRDDHTLIWDAKNSKLLTCCGYVGGSGHNSDVWEYQSSGPTWTKATVGATKPSGRYSYDWVWDAGQNVAVLFGGQTASGNSGETWVYDTGGGGGGQAPAIVSTDPVANATNIAVTTRINITFTLAMDKAATESAIGTTPPIVGQYSWSAGDTKLTLAPSSALTAATKYTVSIGIGAKSAQGVALPAPYLFSFTTAGGGGNVPAVTTTNPADNSTNVPVSTNIDITFSTAMDKTATAAAISLSPNEPGAATWSAGDAKYTLDPTADLAALTKYTVTVNVGAKSSTGQNLPTVHSFSFTSGPGGNPTPPAVLSNSPVNGAMNVPLNTNIVINFDKAMDKTATEGAITRTPNPPNQGTWTWTNADATVTIDPTGDLAASTKYTLMVGTGSKSAQGVALPSMHMFDFTTGSVSDLSPPAIVHQVPGPVEEATPIEIKATVTDDTSVGTVTLHYRAVGEIVFTKANMAPGASDEFKATVPASAVKPTKVEYYIEAVDGAAKKTTDPATAPSSLNSIVVNKKGGGGPPGMSPAGIFGMGPTMDLVIIGAIVAVVIAAVAAMMMMKRKKKAQAAPGGSPFQSGYGPQPWDQSQQGQWQQPPGGPGY